MSSSKTLPEVFGGDVEVTLVAPSPDVAGAQLEEWIKEAPPASSKEAILASRCMDWNYALRLAAAY
ncbi:hypothetical protein BFJ63_vAg16128 [Fusarium oxysporum f. sp. narcissi]|uniref:Uncharacterized protein n=1 Tax=Fusarium oxysporum f. sp. narcissi TaxID=451672 RepID=A0A4Q2V246_FUSOX|nr:hypothetical protein BFJ63_vAg16128 [Fusarium oxysporum f. sp. narcissi]